LQCVAGSCHPHLGRPDPRRDAEGILQHPRDPFRMLHAEAFFFAAMLKFCVPQTVDIALYLTLQIVDAVIYAALHSMDRVVSPGLSSDFAVCELLYDSVCMTARFGMGGG
jgi:hypothetical protein